MCKNQPFLSQEFKKQRILGEMAGLRISRSKEVTFDIKVTIEISCLMDFSDYPFDDHTCSFQVGGLTWRHLSPGGQLLLRQELRHLLLHLPEPQEEQQEGEHREGPAAHHRVQRLVPVQADGQVGHGLNTANLASG